MAERPDGSARNVLRGPVTSVAIEADRARVRVGSSPPLFAELTVGSLERLGLRPGERGLGLREGRGDRGPRHLSTLRTPPRILGNPWPRPPRAQQPAPGEPDDDAPDRPLDTAGAGFDATGEGPGASPGARRRREPEREEHRWRFVGSTPFLILVALGVAILVKSFVIQAFYIPSESMVPTLEVGDRVFVNKFLFDEGTSTEAT